MSQDSSHELLSVYFDDETSVEQRREIEQQLRESARLRRELDEIRQVSELLRSLPCESAHEDLASSVVDRVKYQCVKSGHPSAPNSSRLRRWAPLAAALLVMAAASVVVTISLTPPSPDSIADINSSPPAERSGPIDENLVAADKLHPDTPPVLTGQLAQSERKTSSAGERGAAGDVPGTAVAPSRAVPAAKPASQPASKQATAIAPETQSDGRLPRNAETANQFGKPKMPFAGERDVAQLRKKLAEWSYREGAGERAQMLDLKNVRPGDVIAYFAETGDQVTWVDVTVIDVHKAVGSLQVLLSKNAVPPIDEESTVPGLTETTGTREDASNGLFAVYVEASQQQLASTLTELGHRELFADMRVKRPVDIDRTAIAALKSEFAKGTLRLRSEAAEVALERGRAMRRKNSPSPDAKPLDGLPRPTAEKPQQTNDKTPSKNDEKRDGAPEKRSAGNGTVPQVTAEQSLAEAKRNSVSSYKSDVGKRNAATAIDGETASFQLSLRLPAKTPGGKAAFGGAGTSRKEKAADRATTSSAPKQNRPDAQTGRRRPDALAETERTQGKRRRTNTRSVPGNRKGEQSPRTLRSPTQLHSERSASHPNRTVRVVFVFHRRSAKPGAP